jgi:hypothetical protein
MRPFDNTFSSSNTPSAVSGNLILRPCSKRFAVSLKIHRSVFESPCGLHTLRIRFTRRSVLVKQPSFSAHTAAGRNTWLYSLVSTSR